MKQIKIVLGIVLSLIVSLCYADGGRILYQPDFTKTGLQGLRQLPHGGAKEGKWGIRDGSIINEDGGLLFMGSNEWEHYVLTLNFQVVEAETPYPWPGVIVRYEDMDNHIRVQISPKEHHAHIILGSGGKEGRIGSIPGLPAEMNKKHNISVECKGEILTFYFDGKLITTIKNSSLPSCGKIGLIGTREGTPEDERDYAFPYGNYCSRHP